MTESAVQVPPDGAGKKLRTVVVLTDKHQQVVSLADDDGALVDPLTDAQLRSAPVAVSGVVAVSGSVSGPLTDAELRATPVPVSGAVTISDGSGPVTVDGTVGVSGTVPVSGPATDTQLRATPLPVSGTVAVSGSVATTGPLTDAQLRATSVSILDKSALIPVAYDYVSLTYTGSDLTGAVYKAGGSGGTTVATLTMTYSAGVLQTVTRT